MSTFLSEFKRIVEFLDLADYFFYLAQLLNSNLLLIYLGIA